MKQEIRDKIAQMITDVVLEATDVGLKMKKEEVGSYWEGETGSFLDLVSFIDMLIAKAFQDGLNEDRLTDWDD